MAISIDKRVLVTGGTGLLGRYAVAGLLERGYEVHVVTREALSPARIPSDARLHVADLLTSGGRSDVIQAAAPTHLLHLAWYTSHGKFWTAAENLEWVHASLDLLVKFVDAGGRRFVGTGTCAEYAASISPCSEDTTPTEPATLYGTCKHAFGTALEEHRRLGKLSTAWGRVFFLYGPHEHPARFVPSLMFPLLQSQPAGCRCGEHVRDFMHVADVGDALAALLDSEVPGPVNIASGIPVRLGEIARTIARLAGRPDMLTVGAEPATASNPQALLADTRRLKDEVGWFPRIGLDRGLDESLVFYRQQLKLAKAQANDSSGLVDERSLIESQSLL